MSETSTTPEGKLGTSIQNAQCKADPEFEYLIYERQRAGFGHILVYVDKALDLEWECDDEAEAWLSEHQLEKAIAKIQNGIAALEPIAHNWPKDLKLAAKRTIGEAIAAVLRGDVEAADVALGHAERFFKAKSRQVSRCWTLHACLFSCVVVVVLAILTIVFQPTLIAYLHTTTYTLALCFWAGCLGAVMFVILLHRKQPPVDSTAERHLHYIEGLSRIIAGGIAGVLVGAMVKLGLILPIFSKLGTETLAMCASAMVAGASERLAAGIITKIENDKQDLEVSYGDK